MVQEDFKRYMDRQIIEIIRYKKEREEFDSKFDSNKCVFEWIKRNAKSFRDNWNR